MPHMTSNVTLARIASCLLAPAVLLAASCAPKQSAQPSTETTTVVQTPAQPPARATTATAPAAQSAPQPSGGSQPPAPTPGTPLDQAMTTNPAPSGNPPLGDKQDQADNKARLEIQAVYDSQDAALGRKDIAAIKANMAPDLVAVDPNGAKDDADAILKGIHDMIHDAVSVHATTKVVGVALDGAKARATVRATTLFEIPTSMPSAGGDGKNDKYEASSMSVETWIKENGAWKVHHIKLLSNTVKRNGVPQ
jgi:ketosteroid isomerase-like protein